MQKRNDLSYICIALEIKHMAEQPADADVAQLVERNLAKVEVAGSNLVIRSIRVKRPFPQGDGLCAFRPLWNALWSRWFELGAQRSRPKGSHLVIRSIRVKRPFPQGNGLCAF